MAKKKNIKDVEAEELVKDIEETEEEIEEVEEEFEEDEEESEEDEEESEEDEEDEDDKKSKKEEKTKDKKDGYFTTVGRELRKVVWPSAGEIAKYSLAVILFCLILVAFFLGIDALASFIKGLF